MCYAFSSILPLTHQGDLSHPWFFAISLLLSCSLPDILKELDTWSNKATLQFGQEQQSEVA